MRWIAVSLAVALWAAPAGAGEPRAVVELFTSQGCSSCPPADRLLGELAARDGVLALSFHVDYWNYVGWHDPFSSPAATERQRDYSRTIGRRYVYTPQMVVDGVAEGVGSDRRGVEAMLEAALRRPKLTIAVDRAADGASARVYIPAAAHAGAPADVWIVGFDRSHSTVIGRGENRGMTLTNANVVREIDRLGIWSGHAATFTVKLAEPSAKGAALIVQHGPGGPILGAATLRPR